MVYSQIEPFGPHAEELRLGILGATFTSLYMKKGSKFPDPLDYTVSLRNVNKGIKKKAVANTELPEQLKTLFGPNAIPAKQWSRKKKRKKGA